MVVTPEITQNESKEAKQGENTNVPEPEHNRPGEVENRDGDIEVVGQKREVLTALHNHVITKGRHTGEAWARRGHVPVSKDTELRRLASVRPIHSNFEKGPGYLFLK